jgi:signal transduction histidine kinase
MTVTVSRDEPLIRDPAKRWAVIAGVWTGVALFFLLQDTVGSIAVRGTQLEAWRVRSGLVYWWLWIPLTPIALQAARRFRISRATWPRALAVHTLLAIVVSLVHDLLLFGLVAVLEGSALRMSPPADPVTLAWLRRLQNLTGFEDYWALIGAYYAFDYARKYRERAVAAAQLETRLAQAELQALRMQLQPHFLFNTLHAVSMLHFTDTDAANRVLVRLSDLLRMSLDNAGRQVVPLRAELEFLTKYLELEQTRFHDRLQVSYDVDPQLLDLEVPHLILQPLVENAIRHGIAQLARDGRIEIAGRRLPHHLELCVCDNGPGLRDGWSAETDAGIGISNLRARLRQAYGAAELLTLEEPPEGGLCAIVRIPL